MILYTSPVSNNHITCYKFQLTADWADTWVQPTILAPLSGLSAAARLLRSIRAGISCWAISISLLPKSACLMFLMQKSVNPFEFTWNSCSLLKFNRLFWLFNNIIQAFECNWCFMGSILFYENAKTCLVVLHIKQSIVVMWQKESVF